MQPLFHENAIQTPGLNIMPDYCWWNKKKLRARLLPRIELIWIYDKLRFNIWLTDEVVRSKGYIVEMWMPLEIAVCLSRLEWRVPLEAKKKLFIAGKRSSGQVAKTWDLRGQVEYGPGWRCIFGFRFGSYLCHLFGSKFRFRVFNLN